MELIIDRTKADVDRVFALRAKGWEGMTADEKAYWLRGSPIELYTIDGPLEALDGPVSCRDGIIKGAYNAVDLNRVEAAAAYLSELLGQYGYLVPYTPRPEVPAQFITIWLSELSGIELDEEDDEIVAAYEIPAHTEWIVEDIPSQSDMARYLGNVRRLAENYAVLPTSPALPGSMDSLTHTGANAIEKVMLDIETLTAAMPSIFLRAGTDEAGIEFYFAN